jgi:hypothetical protein
VDITDGLPKWSGMDKKSDLIGDTPAKMVREFKKDQEDDRRKRQKTGNED